ncbi:E3 ubiquitin-protein ligase MIB2 [Halotydeus destructor]|nr:E3 ubiquitin-protein ligase MIB2 [Halotydeus destructor]
MDVGVRVVRGPDWKWSNQDDGEGHLGTIVEIGSPESDSTPDKTVVVQWDSGSRTNYRIGYQGSFDLRVLDNAPIGVRHQNIVCHSCHKQGIFGMRWKCFVCPNYDMCTNCYMADKHDLDHPFVRYETSTSAGVQMPKRSLKTSSKIQSRGIFVGARVVRGFDWDWGNQDGGDGKVGKVIDIRGWDNESRRSVANVMWAYGATNVYRLGHKGKVDLKYVVDSPGGNYYRDHLPIAGQQPPQLSPRPSDVEGAAALPSSSSAAVPYPRYQYTVGERVQVVVRDEEELKSLQAGHGGWNPRMTPYISHTGTVHRITDKGDIRVKFEGCLNRWTFNPEVLRKVPTFGVGDVVAIIEDEPKVRELQTGHGEWTSQMCSALGKRGTVVKVYADGDLRVCLEGNRTWTFNPLCVEVISSAVAPSDPSQPLNLDRPVLERTGNSLSGHRLQMEVTQQPVLTPSPDVARSVTSNSQGPSRTSVKEAKITIQKDANVPDDPAERLRYLEVRIAEMEEATCCGICMERIKNVVFLCGHGTCAKCAQTLKTCHMCREPITKKINVY